MANFRVIASRHPELGKDYDAKTHRYTSSYLNNKKYTLTVDAFPGKRVLINAGDRQFTPRDRPSGRPRDIVKLRIPNDTVAFDFSIKQIGKQFSAKVSHPTEVSFEDSSTYAPWEWEITVPGEGAYEISVQLRNRANGGPKSTRRIVIRDHLVVSIGDSLASGQGNPDIPGTPKGFDPDIDWWDIVIPPLGIYEIAKASYEKISNYMKREFTTWARKSDWILEMDPAPVWLEKKAYRSLRSSHALAARKMEDAQEGRLITFLSFARSGSEIEAGLLGPRTENNKRIDDWIGNIGQLDEIRRTIGNRHIDVLLISIGVNDIGITGTLTDLVANDFFIEGGDDAAERDIVKQRIANRIRELPAKFAKLKDALDLLDIHHVYLSEYPTSLFDKANGQLGTGCGIFSSKFDLDMDIDDVQVVREAAEALNHCLRNVAKQYGWFLVSGIAEAFKGHGYCTDDETRYFVQAEESMILQGDTEGTVHPNRLGHKVYAEKIAHLVQENTLKKLESGALIGVFLGAPLTSTDTPALDMATDDQ